MPTFLGMFFFAQTPLNVNISSLSLKVPEIFPSGVKWPSGNPPPLTFNAIVC